MTIAVVISTHGKAAEQLLQTAEMLLGKQNNVGCIDFITNENAEILIIKYQKLLATMDISDGVFFLVDTWGGTPFNAASRLILEKTNYEVISGVNIPMLVELLMAREDNLSFDELIKLALDAGREGIKAKHFKQSNKTSSIVNNSSIPKESFPISLGKYMKICLARIDDRLIHGQVVTSWTKETQVNRIIVVSDEVAADNIRKTLLKEVAPPGVTAHVVDIPKMVRVWNNPKYNGDKVMLLFTNPTDVVRVVDKGVNITSVNIGGMAFSHGKTQINTAVSVDEKDILAFKTLNDRNIELEVRKVSSDQKIKMMDLINNMHR